MRASNRAARLAVVTGAAAALVPGLLLGPAAAPAAATGHGERVRSDDVDLRVSADGALDVTETIAYDTGSRRDRHGVERTIPVRGPWDRDHDRITSLSGVRASSPTGAPAAVRVSTADGVATVRVGDPGRHVQERQTYVLRYRLAHAAGTAGHPDRLAVDVLGTGWRIPVDAVTAHLSGPAAPVAARCTAGTAGSTAGCPVSTGGGAVLARATGLGGGRGMTVTADYPVGTLTGRPALVRTATAGFATGAGPVGASLGLLVLLLAALVVRVRRARVAGQGAEVPGTEALAGGLRPPDGVRPAQLGMLLHARASRRDLAATLLDLAARGYLVIGDRGDGDAGGRPVDWQLLPGPATGDPAARRLLRPYEQRTLTVALGADGRGRLLSEVRQDRAVAGVLADASREAVEAGWFSTDPRSVRVRWYAVGVAGLGVGAVATGVLAATTSWGLLGLAVVVASLAVLGAAHAMPVRTPAGATATTRARAFREQMQHRLPRALRRGPASPVRPSRPPRSVTGVAGVSEQSVARVFDAAAAEYEATGTAYFAPMGRRLVELAGLRPGQRVLDVGTGRGAVLHPAAAAVGPDGLVLGLDLSARMAALTAADLAVRRPPACAAVVVADADRPPVIGPFDVVLGGMVAQFLPAPGLALRRWSDVAAPGGRLGLSWWAGEDERFTSLGEVVARHVPPGGRRAPRAFSGDVATTEGAVVAAGWTGVRTLVEEQDVVFADTAAWWRWSWSHGQRRHWQAVPDLGLLRRDVDPQLQRLAEPDGRIRYRPRAAYTLAVRAGVPGRDRTP